MPSAAHTMTPSPIARMTALSSAARECSDWARRWSRTWTSIRSRMSRAMATIADVPSGSSTRWITSSTEIVGPCAVLSSVMIVRHVAPAGCQLVDDGQQPGRLHRRETIRERAAR